MSLQHGFLHLIFHSAGGLISLVTLYLQFRATPSCIRLTTIGPDLLEAPHELEKPSSPFVHGPIMDPWRERHRKAIGLGRPDNFTLRRSMMPERMGMQRQP